MAAKEETMRRAQECPICLNQGRPQMSSLRIVLAIRIVLIIVSRTG
jgi:hypothetical protein